MNRLLTILRTAVLAGDHLASCIMASVGEGGNATPGIVRLQESLLSEDGGVFGWTGVSFNGADPHESDWGSLVGTGGVIRIVSYRCLGIELGSVEIAVGVGGEILYGEAVYGVVGHPELGRNSSSGWRRMADTAVHLVGDVVSHLRGMILTESAARSREVVGSWSSGVGIECSEGLAEAVRSEAVRQLSFFCATAV